MDAQRERIVADPQMLGVDIAAIFIQASNEKKLLFRRLMTRQADVETFLNFLEAFYGLYDRTGHHVKSDDMEEFFRDIMNWTAEQDDEEEFGDELTVKIRDSMEKFDEYRIRLKEAGILDLIRTAELGEMER